MGKKEVLYKNAFKRLEEIQKLIEDDKLDIDELTKVLKEAANLLKICKERLYVVNEETKKILDSIR